MFIHLNIKYVEYLCFWNKMEFKALIWWGVKKEKKATQCLVLSITERQSGKRSSESTTSMFCGLQNHKRSRNKESKHMILSRCIDQTWTPCSLCQSIEPKFYLESAHNYHGAWQPPWNIYHSKPDTTPTAFALWLF